MRIRGYDEETEEFVGNVEELSGEIADLTKTASTPGGISLFSDETKTEYKSTRQLLEEISEIYDDLNDKTQAELLEALAGKRQGQFVAAILNNFDAVKDSLDSMANSAGNAEAEMSVAINSISYKSNKLKETGTGIAQNLFKREDMKTVLDTMNSLGEGLDWLTKKLGLFGTITLGAGLFAGIKNIGNFKQQVTGISNVLNNLGNTTKLLTSFNALDVAQQKVLLSSKLLTEEEKAQCITMATLSSANTKYTAEQLVKATGISNETLATWGLTQATDTLTISQLAEMASSDAQAKAVLDKIIAQNAQAVANGEVTASNIALASSETGTALATGAFTTAIKANISAMLTWMATNPIGWFTAIAGSVLIGAKAISSFTDSIEETKEKSDELISSYKSAIDTANANKKSIEEIADRYEILSKGVNNLGENVSLTTDEFEEYNSIVNKIAQMFPELVSGYDEQGNAILKLKGNVEELRDAYKDAQKEAYNMLITTGKDSDGNDILKNANNVINKANPGGIFGKGATLGGSKETLKYIDEISNILSSDKYKETLLNKTGLGTSLDPSDDDENFRKWFSYLTGISTDGKAYIEDITDEQVSEIIKQLRISKQVIKSEVESVVNDTELLADAFLQTNETFNDDSKFTDQLRKATSLLVNNLNEDIVSSFGEDKNNVGKYVNDIVDSISNNKEVQNALIELFTMPTSEMSVDEIESSINNYINIISEFIGRDPIDLKIGLGFDNSDTETLKNKVKTFLYDEFDNNIGTLNTEDLKIASELEIPQNTLLTWDELINKIKEVKKVSESKNKTNSFFNLSEDSNKVLDDYQKSFKDIKKTLQDINSLDDDEILDIIQEYNLDTAKATSSTQGLREELERVANEKFDALLESLNEMRDCGELTKEEFENLVSLFEKLSNISLLDFTRNSFDDLSKEINNVASKLKDIDSAIDSVNKGEKLNASSVLSLVQTYPELAKNIKKTTDGYEIEVSVLEELRKKDLEVQSSKIRSEIDKTKATIEESKTRVLAYSSEISALEELKKVQDSFGTESVKPTVPLWLQDAMDVFPNATPVEDTLNQLKEKQKKDLQDINESQKLIESLYEQLNLLGSGNYSKDSSSGSGSKEDAWKNEADAKIEELRHKLAMELITERTFYNELEKINEKYFKDKKKYQDDYWKYEEEVFSGRAKLYEQDYENDKKVLDKKLNDKKISEKRYYTELRKLNDRYFKDNKKYKDRWQETDDEVTEKLFDIDISSYKNAIQRYENTKKDISNKISSYEAKDKVVPDSYYKKQIKQNNLEIKTYQELAKEYIQLRENARKVSGYNSEAYVEYDNLLQDCQDNVAKLNNENIELNNTLLNLPYERFEKLKDKINNVIDSLSGYLDLLDSLDSYDENGKITDAGTTKMALLQQQLESAKVLAEESTKNIYDIQKKYKNGEFKDNFDEYRKKLLEYQAEQREAVSNIASYRSSIISLINEGIDAETDAMQDLIDKKKEAISVEKELYELQKSATEDNKSIEILNKQIVELERSTDRADIAQRQKLEDELRKKKEKQLDEQKQREFKLREDALEDELKSFKETQDDKKNELRSSLNSQDRIIDGWLNGVITSNNTVFSTLTTLSNNFGLELTSAITDPWTKGIDSITKWSDAVKSALNMNSTSDITTSAPSNVLTKNTSGTKQTAETELNKYIISKGYNKLTWSQMAKLGQDLGVSNSTYKNVESSGVIRMEILKKLKATGFETGGIVRASGVPLTGDRIPIRVNPNETILTKKFTDLLPSTVDIMSKFVDIKMPNMSYINGLSRNTGNDVNMNFSEPLVVISGVTKDEINAETQKRIAEIPNMMLRELKQIGVNKK